MSLTREDFTDIKNELDDRYVLQSDCNDKQDAVNKKFSSDDKRIAIISRHPPHGGCGLKYRKIEYITNKSDRVICRSFLLKMYRKLLKKF